MRSVAVLVFMAILLIAVPATAENVLDQDSLTVLELNQAGAGSASGTIADTVTTYGNKNVDHAAGATLETTNLLNPEYDIYESFRVIYEAFIYTDPARADTALVVNDPTDCTTADADTFTYYHLKCCATSADTAAYTAWLDDSTSWADSNTGTLTMEETYTDVSALAVGDSATEAWSSVNTSVWLTSGQTAFTCKPKGRDVRFRTSELTKTDKIDTIGVTLWYERNDSWSGLSPDYMGPMGIQQDGSDAATYADTILVWPYDGINHYAGQRMKCTYGDDYYTSLAVMVDPLTTSGHAKCSTGGYLALMQSTDGINWIVTDSMQKVGGLAAAGQVPEYDTLLFARGFPYWGLRTQVEADSTDSSTRAIWDVTTTMLK